MTYLMAETAWQFGQAYTVTWDASDAPMNIMSGNSGFILLRSGDYEMSPILAQNIHLRDGQYQVTVPDVVTGSDHSLVLLRDSGNWGPEFMINGPVTF
ncbi:uncharacterized protein PHACADRAFT_142847 [Phanerochaete carnosa HHB-10118-sp]|uniref:Yeast cell wall synthesis Kre9/Knh1-like N-terminal domain-containing protein n=1 Tax=Phanerochaete carnosa (strain HHB-10118-sp) TaxID=650164 RepID=K5W7R6_PHACS|nr:uncharacterized protein PHACADRAFT_142847 [Phanerochaete carnosa HHB-10118-sp]EKM55014.1 hypothetical protein PHACADRAFT_142847 [Phanerochaete carnosa HHB-10118-sp]